MSLLNTFSNKTIQELIIILESGNDYTSEAKETAVTILDLKKVEQEELILEAKSYWKGLLKVNIKSYLLSKEKPASKFLTDEEMSNLFKAAFDNWKENQKTFEVDTTKYWFV